MKILTCLLLVSFVLASCNLSNKDNTMSFNNSEICQGWAEFQSQKGKRWFTVNGTSAIDSTTQYREGMYSLLSVPNVDDTSKVCQTFYHFNATKIEGDSVSFRGNFKVSGKDSICIHFGIQQLSLSGYPKTEKTEDFMLTGDSEWLEFNLTAHMDDYTQDILFFIFAKGDGKIWTSNWHGEIDGKPLGELIPAETSNDKEFDDSSRVSLMPLTTQMVENLEVLGKVWGFLKYYHPQVVQGKYNWDYELFRILPQIAHAKDKKDRSKQISRWIDKYGKITEKEELVISDSTKYSRIINLDWLKDESVFDRELIAKLDDIRNAKRSKKDNHYALKYRSINGYNDAEKSYENISWEDQGYRILTLFRLWNAVEYCAPYVEMTDNPWRLLLKEYIPQFVEPENKTEYELSIIKLFSNVNESHGWIQIPKHSLSGSFLVPHHWARATLVKFVKSADGKVIVSETQRKELQRGDVIVKVGDKSIDDAIKEREPYIATSNPSTLYRDLLPYIFSFASLSTTYTIERDGKEIEIAKSTEPIKTKEKAGIREPQSYNLEKYDIGYIDVAKTKPEQIKEILQKYKKGVIIDMRIYPKYDAMGTLVPLLTDKAYSYVWFSNNEMNRVGNYKFVSENKTEENPDYYKGKVAIIVNEGTQSHGEFSAMAYRKAPRSAIIGSQTAGADGNIQTFYLPGNISITYTGLGTYYPDWEVCQREGLKIDIPVRPTVKGVKEGRDELIEEAIKYITN